MLSKEKIQERLKNANELIPVHSMLDGFWIYDFDNGLLTVTCSFDRLYYRNFDIEFKNVSFFNIPARWDDTNVPGDILFRIADAAEFSRQQPDFNTEGKHIFAINMVYYPPGKDPFRQVFFIVADDIRAEKCLQGNAQPSAYFKDPFEKEPFPRLKNRVI